MADNNEEKQKPGVWDVDTNRYVPMGGGSRSRLPAEENGIRPYSGFLGLDQSMAIKGPTVGDLYRKLGGGARMSRQDEAFVKGLVKKPDD